MIFSHDLSGRSSGYDSTKKKLLLLSPTDHFKLREAIIDELELLKSDIHYSNITQMISDFFSFEKDNKRLETTLFKIENLVRNVLDSKEEE